MGPGTWGCGTGDVVMWDRDVGMRDRGRGNVGPDVEGNVRPWTRDVGLGTGDVGLGTGDVGPGTGGCGDEGPGTCLVESVKMSHRSSTRFEM